MSDRFFSAWFAVCAVLGVAWMGFCVWVIYEVVTWLTSK